MIDLLDYNESLTFVEVTSGDYGNSKVVVEQATVNCIFVQNIQMSRNRFQDNIDADAVCHPHPDDPFISERFNRLEGIYILAPIFGAGDAQSWYKVESCVVNRDHLLDNEIDNIELRLKKASAIPGVS